MWVVILLLPFGKGFSTDKRVLGTLSHINFTTKDGLPSNEVYCVFQDSKGFIWVGTDRGVARFDGYEFKVFTAEDGLTDNVVFRIAEDSSGNIWFVTADRKLSIFRKDECIVPFSKNKQIQKILIEKQRVGSVYFDNLFIDSNDVLFLSNYELGYLKIKLQEQNNIIEFVPSLDVFLDYSMADIELVRDGQFSFAFVNSCTWFSVEELSLNYGEKSLSYIHLLGKRERPYYFNDSLLIVGRNLINIHQNNKVIKRFDGIVHIYQVSNGYLINEVINNGNRKVYFTESLTDIQLKEPLVSDNIRLTVPIADNNGGLWFGSLENGLYYLPNLNVNIVRDEVNVSAILPTKNGLIYNERWIVHKKDIGRDEKITSSIRLEDLSIESNVSYKFNHQIRVEELAKELVKRKIFTAPTINEISFHNGYQYLALGRRLFVYKPDKTIELLNVFDFRISAMDFSNSENLFLGFNNNTIAKFSNVHELKEFDVSKENLFLSTKYKPIEIKYIPTIKALAVVYAGRGLTLIFDDLSERKITTNSGLLSNSINQLVLKNDSQLWVTTNKGVNILDCFTVDSIKISALFNSSKSLLSPNVKQIFFENDSLVYIGTDHGLNALHLSKKQKELKANTYIEKIQVNGKTAKNRSRFKFDENTVEISYISLQYNHFGNVNYRYKLEGLSDQWVHSKERKATFLNLNPGKYSFYLQAQNESGSWDDLDHHFSFEIEKPFWTSWWFIIAVAFGIMLFIGVVLYYYIDNLRKERSFLKQEKLMSDKLNEIQQKALNSQLNPHFVFNSLNSIQNFILTKRTELSSDYLSMFSKLMRYVFENSKALYVSLADEIKALELYLKLERVRHNDKFDFEFSVKEIDLNKVNIPSLLIQPTVENAIWHGLLSADRKDKKLEIRIFMQNENLIIEVEDNGVGRNYKKGFEKVKVIKKQKSSGIELTQHRLKLLRESTGLETDFQIIDLFDENNTACGTLVRIQIPKKLQQ
ncbi:MAG: histidine kinase [Flavobacteriales bacterium]